MKVDTLEKKHIWFNKDSLRVCNRQQQGNRGESTKEKNREVSDKEEREAESEEEISITNQKGQTEFFEAIKPRLIRSKALQPTFFQKASHRKTETRVKKDQKQV